jgi:hypothetical protein
MTFDLVRRSKDCDYQLLKLEYDDSFREGNVAAVVSAVYLDDEYLGAKGFQRSLEHIESLNKEIKGNSNYCICTSVDALKEANKKRSNWDYDFTCRR